MTKDPHVHLEHHLAADPARVYAAWTDPALISRWYCPNPDLPVTATTDLVVGGAYRVEMGPHVVEGVFTELRPDEVIAFTWQWTSLGEPVSHVRVELSPAEGGGTHLVLRHTGLSPEDAEGHTEGWTLSLARLEQELAAG